MKNRTSILSLSLVAALWSGVAFGQKVGSTSMQFLKVMPGARGTAMGDSYSVWATGVDALFWNPGGLPLMENSEMTFSYTNWIFDTQQGAIGFATSLGSLGAVGVQFQYVDFGEFMETSALEPFIKDPVYPGATGNTFRPFSYIIGASYGARITNKFSTGVTVKYAHESLYNGNTISALINPVAGTYQSVQTWASGVLFDFGLHYETGYRTVKVGASFQNFGPSLKYATTENSAPLAMRFGVGADVVGTDALLLENEGSRLGVSFDLFQPNDYKQQYHAGMEYEYEHLVFLRAGYKFNYDADGFTAGLGVQQTFGGMRLFVDYSYAALGYQLGNIHRIGVGAGF